MAGRNTGPFDHCTVLYDAHGIPTGVIMRPAKASKASKKPPVGPAPSHVATENLAKVDDFKLLLIADKEGVVRMSRQGWDETKHLLPGETLEVTRLATSWMIGKRAASK